MIIKNLVDDAGEGVIETPCWWSRCDLWEKNDVECYFREFCGGIIEVEVYDVCFYYSYMQISHRDGAVVCIQTDRNDWKIFIRSCLSKKEKVNWKEEGF